MSNSNFSFTYYSIKEITDFYDRFLEEISDTMIGLINVFRESKETTKYKVIGEKGNILIDFYNDRVLRSISHISNDLADSSRYLRGMSRKLNVGDEGEHVAHQLSQSLIISIDDLLVKQELISLNDTAEIQMNEEVYDHMRSQVMKRIEELDAIIRYAYRRYEQLCEVNEAAGSLGPLISTVEGSIVNPFTELGNSILHQLQDSYKETMKRVHADFKEDTIRSGTEAKKAMNNAEQDLLKDMLKLFND